MTVQYTTGDVHRESVLEDHLVAQLIHQQGYIERSPDDFDRASALDRELVVRFLRETQADEWAKLEAHYPGSAETQLFTQLERALKQRGTLDVLRHGLRLVPNIRFILCAFKPASDLNPELTRLYETNILSVMRQVRYSLRSEKALDVVLSVNGLPVVTMELKNRPTGTNFRHAEQQYRRDRPPAGEPLLTFKRGALVHFALDEDNVSMTTRLMNSKTRFLPFNRGRDEGAGNPDIPDEFRIAYLYADQPQGGAVFSREVLLDLVGRFIHLENGKNGSTAMIFPRFQQMDAVRQLMAHAREHGPGHNYLVQHSAGSGKSLTIGWLAHQAISLHGEQDQPIFNTAIIVTDRIVLDRQLQATIGQLEQTAGVVRKIDGTSHQLKAAIKSKARIIVTTIQKFSTEHLRAISDQGERTFAVIVDEAHSGQSGRSADALTATLTRTAENSEDVEDIIAEHQQRRGPQSNISYFAFTATPRNVTLERFGVPTPDGRPLPFHLYSMRQAIEEKFILDVLKNYMTYKAYYQLEKAIEDDPELRTRRGQQQVARFAALHPTAISQKVEAMVEHFRRHVMDQLDGGAKAMIVTQSRAHALRYYFGVKDYLEQRNYTDLRALVAFSGDLKLNGQTWTEAGVNGFAETELPRRFAGPEYHLLIVAEKYQTGFDEPALCAIYVDRKLAGLQAVQTLSRLNRTHSHFPEKETYILDFQNTIADIQAAFRPYYEVTELEAVSDPNQIYQLEARLRTFGIVDQGEVERFAQTYFRGPLAPPDRIRLESLVRQAVPRFELEEDEGRQEEFRQLLRSYTRFYAFLAQVVQLGDTWLEKLYVYAVWLLRFLPSREQPPEIEVTEDMIRLAAFRLEGAGGVRDEPAVYDASLSPGDTERLKPITGFGANPYTEEEERSLSEIIASFNERHGTEFSKEDFLGGEQSTKNILADDGMVEMLRNNPPDVVYGAFSEALVKDLIHRFQREKEMRSIILTDAVAREQFTRHFFRRAMRLVREEGEGA